MKYEGLENYAINHTIKECAEYFNCNLICMKSYIYKHKIKFKKQDINGVNNPNYKHGGKHTRLYHIWQSMRDRCYRVNNKQYKDYGARGIKVCEEWNNFYVFKEWAISNGYSDTLTIDRIDNNKGYCTENCKWSTSYMQNNNKRNNRFITYNGVTKTVAQWCKELGFNYGTITSRLNRGKMNVNMLFIKEDFNKNKKLYKALKQGKQLLDTGMTDASLFILEE